MSEEQKDSILTFHDDSGEDINFVILAQTQSDGKDYLLVQDPSDDVAYILVAESEDEQDTTYRMIDDEEKLAELAELFDDLLEDVDLEL